MPCCLFSGLKWPAADLKSGASQRALAWMWTACSPTGRFLRSTLMESLLFCCWKVAVPASSPVLVLRGTTISFLGFLAKAGMASRQRVSAASVLRIRWISNRRLPVRRQKYLFGLRDAEGFLGKIWFMISTRCFSSFKFVLLLCLFGFVSATACSRAQAQQGRRGAPPAPEAAPEAKPAAGAEAKPAAAAEGKAGATPGMAMAEPPLPPDAHAEQSIQMEGKTLHYTATVGTLAVRDSKGALSGEVVYTAYIVEGKDRPVTFAFNGGPGAASVYLNLGAIGPKKVAFGAEGQSPSDPATLTDNPGTWLDFTDIVFIDPIGTGFSRSLVSMDEAKKQFYG